MNCFLYRRALNIIDEYIETLVIEQDFLSSEERWNKVVKCLPRKYIIRIIIIIKQLILKDLQNNYKKIGKLETRRHGKDGREWSLY